MPVVHSHARFTGCDLRMDEVFVSDEEYPNYFSTLGGLRARIAADLPIKPGMSILDLAAGYGYFALEVAKREPSVQITGIDLSDTDVEEFKNNVAELGLEDRLKSLKMDATRMDFPGNEFDMVINFLGLEDIHMTRGREGVKKTFAKVARVLKPSGYFCFTAMLADQAETEAQKLEIELFSWLCNATWLSAEEYEKMLADNGFKLIRKSAYVTGKKLTPAQAEEEISFACENLPRIYGIKTPSFDEAWKRFGSLIQKHGMGHYSKVSAWIARKDSK